MPSASHVGLLRGVLRLRVVVVLFGDDSAAEQVGHAAGSEARQVFIGAALLDGGFGLLHAALDLIDGGVGLQNLLIEFRGFDFGDHLTGLHAIADIDVAFADVAGGAGQNGSFGHGLNVARKDELAIARGARHAADVDDRESGAGLFRFRGKDRFPPLSRKKAHEKARHNQACQQQGDQHQADGGGAPIRVVARRVQVFLLFQLPLQRFNFGPQPVFGSVDFVHDKSSRSIISSRKYSCSSSSILRSKSTGGFLRSRL